MPLKLEDERVVEWRVHKIAVIGPGIVGMPMAALLAQGRIRIGTDEPARVLVIQRRSPSSGWKVESINEGRSPIGGVEPELDRIVAEAVGVGLLAATHDMEAARDADVVLVCVQTDKRESEPDYGPLFDALNGLAGALARRPAGNLPLVVVESTLAPSSMATVIRERFAANGLQEGRDVLLGNSPNRVMPGRLVERVAASDKIVAGLHPATAGLVARLYGHIVTRGTLHPTSSLTAEIVKTLENAYRDVRIAAAAEFARYCDTHDIDFYALREQVNLSLGQTDTASRDPLAVPTGAVLVPTLGVGGHCLPKDGVLLWWRALEAGMSTKRSLILEARRINEESPAATLALAERRFGDLGGRRVVLLGAAYRPESEDTRNSPTLALARLLQAKGCQTILHDPHVRANDPNLVEHGFADLFTRDLDRALADADLVFLCVAHSAYAAAVRGLLQGERPATGVVDGCNLVGRAEIRRARVPFVGIGKARNAPDPALVEFMRECFRVIERGVANEVQQLVEFLNERYAHSEGERADFEEVRRLAATCATGCAIGQPGPVSKPGAYRGFVPRLTARAAWDAGLQVAS